MRSYESRALVDAAPEKVWTVLKDIGGWSSWNSGVLGVDGQLEPGQKLTIRSSASPGRAFPVQVSVVDPGRRIELRGGMPLGLFRGVRTYTLRPQSDQSTLFTMREEFTGPLLPMMWRSMPDLQPSFDQFARGLKERVEAH